MKQTKLCLLWLALATILFASPSTIWADTNAFAQSVSDSIGPFVVAGELAVFSDGHSGRDAAVQGLKAFAVNEAATSILKAAVRERRPHGLSYSSFPSRHTSAAFCMATVIAEYDSSWTLPAYGYAALIGWSRVETDSHYWWDVVAGAVLGHYIAKAFVEKHHGSSGQGIGFQVNW